jgi:hypothetical protein
VFKNKWGLPEQRSIERFFSDADFAGLRFDPSLHRIPIDSYRPEPLTLEHDRGFRFLAVAGADDVGWHEAVHAYLSTYRAADDVLLLLKVATAGAEDAVIQELSLLVEEVGVTPEDCAEVVVVDSALGPEGDARVFATADAVLAPDGRISMDDRRHAELSKTTILESPDSQVLLAASTAGRKH